MGLIEITTAGLKRGDAIIQERSSVSLLVLDAKRHGPRGYWLVTVTPSNSDKVLRLTYRSRRKLLVERVAARRINDAMAAMDA